VRNIAESKRNWDFWGMEAATHLPGGKRRLPLHCYATLLGGLLLVAVLFGFRLGVFLDIGLVWLVFS